MRKLLFYASILCALLWLRTICLKERVQKMMDAGNPIPARGPSTYTRLVELAINLRKQDAQLDECFMMCIPGEFVGMIAKLFPEYKHYVLGGCFTQREEVHVKFVPVALKAK